MLYALDTEFMEDGSTIELISIGVVAEDGRTFYAQNRNAVHAHATLWVQEHVLLYLDHRDCRQIGKQGSIGRMNPHCRTIDCPWLYHDQIGDAIRGWMAETSDFSPTFIGYYCAYDWVVLCQLFGTMMALPKGWPRYCIDLRYALDSRGYTGITQPDEMIHHSLSDAQWIMETWKMMEQREGTSRERRAAYAAP